MTDEPGLFSREEVLAGLPARRARTLIYLIERVAVRHRADREVGTMALLGERAAEARELAWIEAFALDEEAQGKPTVQEIEATAGRWSELVPASAAIRAATARLLAEGYRLDRRRVTGIRSALGLDSKDVTDAFERQTGRPLDSIFSSATPFERLRWLAATPGRWLEETTPFRAAAALTFLLSLGQTVVIVPIAVAAVGPLAGAASILVVGLLALSATAAVAEATTRNGEVRFRGAFFGRMVTSALGVRAGAVPAMLGIAGVVLPTLSAFIGLALLLALTTSIPPTLWVAVLGAIAVAVPLRGRRTASFGGLLVFGLMSAAMLAALSLLVVGLAAVEGELAVPPLSPPAGIALDTALGLIIGVLLGSYADPVYTVQIGRIILPRDPDGVGYVRGSVVGIAAFVAVTAAFSAVLLFVVPPADLAGEDGSALDAVSGRFGPAAIALATVIGVGLFGIRLYGNTIALFDFVTERLPGLRPRRVVLRADRGRVLISRPGEDTPGASLAYRGMRGGRPVIEVVDGSRPGAEVRSLPALGEAERIRLGEQLLGAEVLEADERTLRLALTTDLPISYDGAPRAVAPGVAESLLGVETARLSAWLLRQGGGSVGEVANHFRWSEGEARERLDELVAGGGAAIENDDRFVPRMAARRRGSGLSSDVWARLGLDRDPQPAGQPEGLASTRLGARVLTSPTGRMVVASLPAAALAALAAVLIALGTASVSGPIRIVGVIAFATISGLLPPLLLLAARRRSEVAGGHGGGVLVGPVLASLTAAAALAALILHATILWTDPIERGVAAVATVLALATAFLATRHGAFRPAALLELRQWDDGEPVRILGEESGHPLKVEITVGEGAAEAAPEISLEQASRGVTVRGRTTTAEELRISAHRLEPSGTARALPLTVELAPETEAGAEAPALDQPGPVSLEEHGGDATFFAGGNWALVFRSEGGGT